MSNPATDFLGSGIAFPYRVAARGLPDLEFACGAPLVGGVASFLLNTRRGDLQWDQLLGADPESLRLTQTDGVGGQALSDLIEQGLILGDPRIVDTKARVTRLPSQERMDVKAELRLIENPTGDNDVRLPLRQQQDVLREVPQLRMAIQGFNDAVTIIPGIPS